MTENTEARQLRQEIRDLKNELAEHRKALHLQDKGFDVRLSVLETKYGYIAAKVSALVATAVTAIGIVVDRVFF